MQIAIAQLNIQAGKPLVNFMQMKQMIESAKQQKADLIIFPEMCLTGNNIKDKWLDQKWCEYVAAFNDDIKALSSEIGIIFGNIILSNNSDCLNKPINTSLFAQNNQWVKRAHLNTVDGFKQNGIGYNSRYFHVLKANPEPFEFLYKEKIQRIEILINKEMKSTSANNQNIDLTVIIDAEAWYENKKLFNEFDESKSVPLIYVNACGMQNTGKNIVMFDGGSVVFNKQGQCINQCNDAFEQELKVVNLSDKIEIKKTENKLYLALVHALKEVDAQLFNPEMKWIVGCSGGLDSSISAALLVKALGKERVVGYNLATSYNSKTTKENATMLCKALEIECRSCSIEKIIEATQSVCLEAGYSESSNPLVAENIQARLRGHMLSTFASIENGVVINNGNKLEVALGYCTLYGDAIGVLAILGDCTKVQLFALAKTINQDFKAEVIPSNLLPVLKEGKVVWEMLPSAELQHQQIDPMKWFYHDWLINYLTNKPRMSVETYMEEYLEGTLFKQPIAQWLNYYGLDNPIHFISDLNWFIDTLNKAAFKRIQMPPIVSITQGSFGLDYCEVQARFERTAYFQVLEQKILEMGKVNA